MIQTPKAHFFSNLIAVKQHADTVSTDAFQKALESALLEYSSQCAKEPNTDEGHFKHKGAFEFSRLLCTLHVPPKELIHHDPDNLE